MADTKVDLKELPKHSSRVFTRVDSVELVPTVIYDAYDVPQEDRASFTVRPASPSVRDDLKDVVLAIDAVKDEILNSYGVTQADLATFSDKAKKGKKYNSILLAFSKVSIYSRREMSTEETRAKLAECVVKIDNYKQDDNGSLVLSTDTPSQILSTIPDIFVEWLFKEIQPMSNLTTEEVVGL